MQAAINWAKITTGETFEALATTLVYFEDANAALFGRRGQDGGQDIRSSDGTCVYQAKHHERASAAKAIADAKREFEKVVSYRQPEHARHRQWATVTQWILVTNASFNTSDRQRWDDEIVPLFLKAQLQASYWEQATLEALLAKYPEVARCFFENETRAFLSIAEAKGMVAREEPFLQRGQLGKFFGRQHEQQGIVQFLETDLIYLIVHGPGGIGKTRLLLEVCEDIGGRGEWQVLWALPESMSASSKWFDAINVERSTLLIVDEPANEALLHRLREQLAGRMSKWKIVVTARSAKDPVLSFILGPRTKRHSRELQLEPLPEGDAVNMCCDLLFEGTVDDAQESDRKLAKAVSQRLDRHPVWLTLAIALLKSHGDLSKLPETAEGLADVYLNEVFESERHLPDAQVSSTLRWVALLGTVNREDSSTRNFLAQHTMIGNTDSVLALLHRLVQRRALVERGARNRLVEVKPDVLRDRLLTKWLTVDVGLAKNPIRPSAAAQALVEAILHSVAAGESVPLMRMILASLGRTEVQQDPGKQPLNLLGPLFAGLIDSVPSTGPSKRISMLGTLAEVSYFRPKDMVDLSIAIRRHHAPTEKIEGLFRDREVTNDDVILELAWPVFHGALGADSQDTAKSVLAELVELARLEADLVMRQGGQRLPNDGRRAATLLERSLSGSPEFHEDLQDLGCRMAIELVEELSHQQASTGGDAVLRAIVRPLMALHKHHETATRDLIRIRRYVPRPETEAWAIRHVITVAIRRALEDDATSQHSRKFFWTLLADAHGEATQLRGLISKDLAAETALRRIQLDDLTWAMRVIGAQTPMAEITAARRLWHWHAKHETDQDLREAAVQLESVYTNNELTIEFGPLLQHDKRAEWTANERAKVEELAAIGTVEALTTFLDRASRFLGGDSELYRLSSFAAALGASATAIPCVHDFVKAELAVPASGKLTFGLRVAEASVQAVRQQHPNGDQAFELAKVLFAAAAGDEQRIRLLGALYVDSVPGRLKRFPSPVECDWLRGFHDLFLRNRRGPEFVAMVGWTLCSDWHGYQRTIEQALDQIPSEQLPHAANALIDRVYWAVDLAETQTQFPPDLVSWLLERLMKLPEFELTGDDGNWQLNAIVERLGALPLSWLPRALRTRRELESATRVDFRHPLASPNLFGRLVQSVSESNKGTADVTGAISELLDIAGDRGAIGYYLPELASIVDPAGLAIPSLAAERLRASHDSEEVWALAKVAGAYPIGSESWRTIAMPAIRFATEAGTGDRRDIFGALEGQRSRFWTNRIGEVPEVFVSVVADARKRLADEREPDLRPFWEWYLEQAAATLSRFEQEAKEERGD